jgi:hypothetical protein
MKTKNHNNKHPNKATINLEQCEFLFVLSALAQEIPQAIFFEKNCFPILTAH